MITELAQELSNTHWNLSFFFIIIRTLISDHLTGFLSTMIIRKSNNTKSRSTAAAASRDQFKASSLRHTRRLLWPIRDFLGPSSVTKLKVAGSNPLPASSRRCRSPPAPAWRPAPRLSDFAFASDLSSWNWEQKGLARDGAQARDHRAIVHFDFSPTDNLSPIRELLGQKVMK